MVFLDRIAAGQMLGTRLGQFANRKSVLVLALPRGGVPVGFQVALALHAPLDAYLVRKLGFPGQEELAIGAIASGGVRLLNEKMIRSLHLPPQQVEAITQQETQELERRQHLYRDDRGTPPIEGNTVILVDDGMATGYTMRVAVTALRQRCPLEIIVAVPVASSGSCREVAREANSVVCLSTPPDFYAVGEWYRKFPQVSDAEVREWLDRAQLQSGLSPP
jgi:putative phosphoribosyl transferase